MLFKDRFNFENIVNVLATGTYGNSYLSCYVAYDAKSQGLAYDIREGKAKPENGVVCREDVWAYVLTNGGKIVFLFDDIVTTFSTITASRAVLTGKNVFCLVAINNNR